ncbi:MAG: M20 family metallopeptidase [Anaerolineae bacterium]
MTDPLIRFLESRLDEYLADLRFLASIDSGSCHKPGIDAVVDWLEARFRHLGLAVERYCQAEWGDDLLATWQGRGRGHILLLGHSDTVYPVGTAASRPMKIEGDRVLGPGVADMKGGLLSGLYAIEALQAMGSTNLQCLYFLVVSDEESNVRHALPLIRGLSRQADVVLNLEAARENGDLVTARKALRWYTIEAVGRAAHAGVEPEKGCSAVLALAHHIVALDRLNGLQPGATINVGTVEGGTWPSVVAGYAKARLDLRTWTEADMESLVTAVREQLDREPVPGVRVRMILEEGSVVPAMERTPAVVELERMAQQIARELGFVVQGASTGGASDASYAAAEGTPTLDGLGPVGGLDHSPDEYIVLSSIVPRTALLARLILAICER